MVRDPSMHGRSLLGNREISLLAGGVAHHRSARGRPNAEACDERRREVRPRHSSCETCERAWATGRGAGGAKGGGQGERGRSTRGPGAGPGRPVIGDRSRTESGTREERGKVHHPAAPHRRDAAAPGLSLAEARRGARCGRDDMGRLRGGPGGAAARPRKPHPPGLLPGTA